MLCVRLALRAGLIIVYSTVLILIALSMIEALNTIADIIRDLEKRKEILLIGALVAALVPFTAMLFWIYKVIAVQLYLPIERVRRHFRTQSKA